MVVKGVQMEGQRTVGEASQLIQKYTEERCSEILCIDTVASLFGINRLHLVISTATKGCHLPIAAGGGIASVSDAHALLDSGADKVVVNTGILDRNGLIKELVDEFGSSTVVASVQVTARSGRYTLLGESGRKVYENDFLDWIKLIQEHGVGEILVTSVDRDGTLTGPDIQLLESLSNILSVPTIYSGGIRGQNDIDALSPIDRCLTGVGLGTSLHFGQCKISDVVTEDIITEGVLDFSGINNLETPAGAQGSVISVLDLGLSNVGSISNSLENMGYDVHRCSQPSEIVEGSVIVFPGCGNFSAASQRLKDANLFDFLINWINSDKPYLGVCLGMHMLMDSGDEGGFADGLGIIKGTVVHLSELTEADHTEDVLIPNIGWRKPVPIKSTAKGVLDEGISRGFYYMHSYIARASDADIFASVNYMGVEIPSVLMKYNSIGVQYHPEKSGVNGTLFLGHCLQYLTMLGDSSLVDNVTVDSPSQTQNG